MKNLLAAIALLLAVLIGVTSDRRVLVENTSTNIDRVKREAIIRVQCDHEVGTAAVISKDTLVTAAHVVQDSRECLALYRGRNIRVEVKSVDVGNDFAVLHSKKTLSTILPTTCAGFTTGARYRMIGYAFGRTFTVNNVVATNEFSNGRDRASGKTTPHLRGLRGPQSHPGMSGGPVIDENGVVVGTVIAASLTDSDLSFSKEVRDTALCR